MTKRLCLSPSVLVSATPHDMSLDATRPRCSSPAGASPSCWPPGPRGSPAAHSFPAPCGVPGAGHPVCPDRHDRGKADGSTLPEEGSMPPESEGHEGPADRPGTLDRVEATDQAEASDRADWSSTFVELFESVFGPSHWTGRCLGPFVVNEQEWALSGWITPRGAASAHCAPLLPQCRSGTGRNG